ncbi:hypothetical protein ACWD5R_30930 [Streptomyces sp. NPDC002514]|uniref:hypothetical protein n=1 Tax=Streptomyces sp. NPDC001270 TaxID=3364554 RepID=UPI0036C96F74
MKVAPVRGAAEIGIKGGSKSITGARSARRTVRARRTSGPVWVSSRRHRVLGHSLSDVAVARLPAEVHEIRNEDIARPTPLKDRYINIPGRSLFNIEDSARSQGLRPFRDTDAVEDAGDED